MEPTETILRASQQEHKPEKLQQLRKRDNNFNVFGWLLKKRIFTNNVVINIRNESMESKKNTFMMTCFFPRPFLTFSFALTDPFKV